MDKNDLKLFHRINIEREIIPNKYKLIKNIFNENNISKCSLKFKDNLSRNQEDQFIIFKGKSNYKFNNIINIDKNKLITYFLCNNYEELFSILELYISNIFNGYNIEEISNLLERKIISDSVFVNVLYCLDIIKLNKRKYTKHLKKNLNNTFETTEIIFNLEENFNNQIKNDALLLISKFIELLKSIDEISFNKEIEKLTEVYEKNKIL